MLPVFLSLNSPGLPFVVPHNVCILVWLFQRWCWGFGFQQAWTACCPANFGSTYYQFFCDGGFSDWTDEPEANQCILQRPSHQTRVVEAPTILKTAAIASLLTETKQWMSNILPNFLVVVNLQNGQMHLRTRTRSKSLHLAKLGPSHKDMHAHWTCSVEAHAIQFFW